jgi:hypothetical protein
MKEGGSSGFNGKLGGIKETGKYKFLLVSANWWTSSIATGSNTKWNMGITKHNDEAFRGGNWDYDALSCRCIKDK